MKARRTTQNYLYAAIRFLGFVFLQNYCFVVTHVGMATVYTVDLFEHIQNFTGHPQMSY